MLSLLFQVLVVEYLNFFCYVEFLRQILFYPIAVQEILKTLLDILNMEICKDIKRELRLMTSPNQENTICKFSTSVELHAQNCPYDLCPDVPLF